MIVLDVGRVHQHRKQKALGIGDHMALAPLDPFGSVKPARAAAFRGLGALAIDDAGRRNGIASCRLAGAPHQHAIDPPPEALIAPKIEVVLNGRTRRKVLRQCPPLAAGRQNIEDRVHHRAQRHLARTPQTAALGNHGASTSHSCSVRSLAYRKPSRRYCGRVISVQDIVSSIESRKSDGITKG